MKYSPTIGALAALCVTQELPCDIMTPLAHAESVNSLRIMEMFIIRSLLTRGVIVDAADPLPTATHAIVPNEKRGILKRACQAQTLGSGPSPDVDTAAAFLSFPAFSEAAEAAATPVGCALNYRSLNASSNAYGYLGFTLLESYDTQSCATKCADINGCRSFNIFFERDPAFQPGESCPDPQSTTLIKCVFWGGPISVDNAKNTGFCYYDLDVVIAGSNAYDSLTALFEDGYAMPTSLGTAQLNAPSDCGGFDTYMGSKMFTNSPFDPSLYAAACTAQSEYNLAHPPATGPVQTCQFFNTYLLLKNGLPEGQVCSIVGFRSSCASDQWRDGDHYSVAYSFIYANSTNPGSPRIPCPVATATSLIAASSVLCNHTVALCWVTLPLLSPQLSLTSTITTTLRITTDPSSATIAALPQRRDAATAGVPPALQTFDSDVIPSACSLQATPVTEIHLTHSITIFGSPYM
ncbi:hypothetical protein GQX73_g9463 [Xylaria multiplex]|uniref:Apple domain-containing protein n=1 Tax=Xylaria multiplex TaxID=323545 RepID=A0A7C8MLD6_9PEZI|nr:hypothetical protein GQX73_g9463 [Xylaria multiplex]